MKSLRGWGARHLRWIECCALAALSALVGSAVSPADPFLVDAGFPWLALAPLLIALQHGAGPALASASLLTLGAWLHARTGGAQAPALAQWATGCVVVTGIVGHVRDAWHSQKVAAQAEAQALRYELEHTLRALRVVELSHAKLEQSSEFVRVSLQRALADAERDAAQKSTPAELGRVLLEVLGQHALVQSASLFLAGANGLQRAPVAVLGATFDSAATHPIVQRAFADGRLLAVQGGAEAGDGSVLAAVPLITAAGRKLGVIAVHELPFAAFHAEHLSTLALLVARLSDVLELRLHAGACPSGARAPSAQPVASVLEAS